MNKFHLILFSVCVLAFSGCTEFLENPNPQQSLPSDAAFSTVSDLQTALIGAYDALQDSDFGATGVAINSSILSDDGEWRGSFPSYIEIFERAITPSNGEVFGLWEHSYEAINQANLVLQSLEVIDDPALTTEVADQLRGEASFIRGMAYFELTKAFGLPYGSSSSSDLGVPILTTATLASTDVTFPARNTVQEGYDQAIADLTVAQSALPASGDYGRANATAATALLADIAFQQRNYERAAQLAGEVIDAPGYELTAEPQLPFTNEGSSEEIFAIVSTAQDNPGVNGSLATFHHINGRGGDVVVSPDLRDNGYNAVITTDQRNAAGSDSLADLRREFLTSNGVFNIEKYEDFANNADDLVYLRLGTYYLMRAEALARTEGVNEESIELLNAIRTRAIRVVAEDGSLSDAADFVSYEEEDFDDADELIEAIILERRVELAFEGQRLDDLRRLMRSVRGIDYDSYRLVFPIPQRDLDANSNLVQNPSE
jgi:hypothetical protein